MKLTENRTKTRKLSVSNSLFLTAFPGLTLSNKFGIRSFKVSQWLCDIHWRGYKLIVLLLHRLVNMKKNSKVAARGFKWNTYRISDISHFLFWHSSKIKCQTFVAKWHKNLQLRFWVFPVLKWKVFYLNRIYCMSVNSIKLVVIPFLLFRCKQKCTVIK